MVGTDATQQPRPVQAQPTAQFRNLHGGLGTADPLPTRRGRTAGGCPHQHTASAAGVGTTARAFHTPEWEPCGPDAWSCPQPPAPSPITQHALQMAPPDFD